MNAELSRTGQPTILVIDDSPTIQRVIKHSLKNTSFALETADSGNQGLEKARRLRPSLILLDFVMPDMNGYQVCKELRRDRELEKIPVVLMSSKGEVVGERLVQTMGIVDYITKPFPPEAVLAVVQHVLERHSQPALAEPQTPLLEVGERDLQAPTTSQDLRDDRGREAVRGQLIMLPLGEVFQLLKFQCHTGILHVARGQAHAEIYLREGRIALARARNVDEEFLIGRFLIELGAIAPKDLDLFLEHRQGSRLRLGEQLVKLGQIQPEQLRQALAAQTQALIFEILRWPEGEFVFYVTQKLPEDVLDAGVELSIDAVLMEGFRRVDEWGLIEKEIRDFNTVLAPARDSTGIIRRIKLTPDEEHMLALVDGRRTIREIIRASRRSSFEVCSILYRLLSSRIIRRRASEGQQEEGTSGGN
jgi:DNA-binding response OmpR family regulator